MESPRKDIKDPKDHLIDLIGQQYIGKSKLTIRKVTVYPKNKYILDEFPETTPIKDLAFTLEDRLSSGKKVKLGYPHMYIPGDWSIIEGKSYLDIQDIFPARYYLCITAIDKNLIDIGYCKLLGQLWSSYYEDSHRGYLFQIISKDTFDKMIDWLNT